MLRYGNINTIKFIYRFMSPLFLLRFIQSIALRFRSCWRRFLRSFSADSIDNRRSYLPHKIFIYFISYASTSSDAGKLMTMIRMENCHSYAPLLAFVSGNLQSNISLDDSSSDGWKIKWIKHSISGRGVFFASFLPLFFSSCRSGDVEDAPTNLIGSWGIFHCTNIKISTEDSSLAVHCLKDISTKTDKQRFARVGNVLEAHIKL